MITAVMPTYGRADLAFERGEGAYLYATNGRRYLDFCGGIAVDVLGHAHPHLVEALRSQAGKLWPVAEFGWPCRWVSPERSWTTQSRSRSGHLPVSVTRS